MKIHFATVGSLDFVTGFGITGRATEALSTAIGRHQCRGMNTSLSSHARPRHILRQERSSGWP